jgi:hypothetical protein
MWFGLPCGHIYCHLLSLSYTMTCIVIIWLFNILDGGDLVYHVVTFIVPVLYDDLHSHHLLNIFDGGDLAYHVVSSLYVDIGRVFNTL